MLPDFSRLGVQKFLAVTEDGSLFSSAQFFWVLHGLTSVLKRSAFLKRLRLRSVCACVLKRGVSSEAFLNSSERAPKIHLSDPKIPENPYARNFGGEDFTPQNLGSLVP